MEPLKLDDDGMITVEIGEATAQLDLWEVNDKLYDITHAANLTGTNGEMAPGASDQMFEKILDLMESKGLPRGSHRLANKFLDAIFAAVKELKKKDLGGSTPGSPDSTGPVLSN